MATADELRPLSQVTAYGFALQSDPAHAGEGRAIDDSWVMGAFTTPEGRAVSQLVSYPWSLGDRHPGAYTREVAAIADVGTSPEFRRRGLLRTMMTRLCATPSVTALC